MKRPIRAFWAIPMALAAAGACQNEPAVRRAQADTTVIHVDMTPRWGTNPRLVLEYRADASDVLAPEPIVATALAPAPDGGVFLYDAANNVVRVFGAGGRYERDIGSNGHAEGQYLEPAGLLARKDGGLLVSDPNNHRLSIFDSSGACTETIGVDYGLRAPDPLKADRAGNVYLKSANTDVPTNADWSFFFLKVDTTGAVVDTLRLPPSGMQRTRTFYYDSSDGLRNNFVDAVCSTLDDRGRVVQAYNRDYSIVIGDGEKPRKLVMESEGFLPVTPEERDQWRELAVRFGPERAGTIPDTKPLFRAIRSDGNGRLWVERYARAELVQLYPDQPAVWMDRQAFDVVTTTGDFLGTIILPHHTAAAFAEGMRLWAFETYDDGSILPVCYRIEPSWD